MNYSYIDYACKPMYGCSVFCPGFRKGRAPSEKGTFSAVNGSAR